MESLFHSLVYVYIFLSVYKQPLDPFHWVGQFQITVFWSCTLHRYIQIYSLSVHRICPQHSFTLSFSLLVCFTPVSAYRTPLHSGPQTSLHSQECTQEWCQAPLPDPRPLDHSPALRTAWDQGPWPWPEEAPRPWQLQALGRAPGLGLVVESCRQSVT